jgi:hypothetical protein
VPIRNLLANVVKLRIGLENSFIDKIAVGGEVGAPALPIVCPLSKAMADVDFESRNLTAANGKARIQIHVLCVSRGVLNRGIRTQSRNVFRGEVCRILYMATSRLEGIGKFFHGWNYSMLSARSYARLQFPTVNVQEILGVAPWLPPSGSVKHFQTILLKFGKRWSHQLSSHSMIKYSHNHDVVLCFTRSEVVNG